MASSEVDLCNSALIHLGAGLISSLSDNSDEARACNQFYDDARDGLLTQADWTFATTQQALSKESDTPLFGYSYQYRLPVYPYCLKPLFINDPEDDVPWKVQGRKLLCSQDGVDLQYIFRNEDVSQYSSLFVETFGFYLAHKMAYALTGSRSVAADLRVVYADMLADAADVDAQVGTPEDFTADSLINARL